MFLFLVESWPKKILPVHPPDFGKTSLAAKARARRAGVSLATCARPGQPQFKLTGQCEKALQVAHDDFIS
jgi:hypothetical protein